MAGKVKTVIIAENFTRNLDEIQVFLKDEGRPSFRKLLNKIFKEAIPNISRFPQIGRPFLSRGIGSLEAANLAKRLKKMLSADEDVRELILDDYLILYVIRKKDLALLAIKHHRQLSFDLTRFWQ